MNFVLPFITTLLNHEAIVFIKLTSRILFQNLSPYRFSSWLLEIKGGVVTVCLLVWTGEYMSKYGNVDF